VVAAASYEARTFGIHSAMPISEAYKRCPHAVYLHPRMEEYSRESHLIMEILSSFSPSLEQVSVDEAFLDITGTEKLFGTPPHVAEKIRAAIKGQRRLTASLGIAPNKFLAKLASDMNKPDGITLVPFTQAEIETWLAEKPVGKIWGVGKKTEEHLRSFGVRTIGDLQKFNKDFLTAQFGVYGNDLFDLCRGIDTRLIENDLEAKSISRENTFEKDTADRALLKKTLLTLSQDVARQARQAGIRGKTIVLIYRGTDFTKHTRRCTLPQPTNIANEIYENALKLLEVLPITMKIRLIGTGLAGFSENVQLDLFMNEAGSKSWEKSEAAIDRLVDKYGDTVIKRGSEL
jgi:DNA polymerase-4